MVKARLGDKLLDLLEFFNGGNRNLAQIDYFRLRRLLFGESELELELLPESCWQPEKLDFVKAAVADTERLNGDICELGVFQGGGTLRMAKILRILESGRKIWALDSFQGFPSVDEKDRMTDGSFHAKPGAFTNTSRLEIEKLARLYGVDSWIHLVEGRFDETAPRVFSDDISFSLVVSDCDLYEGTKFCLEFFYDRLITGGYFILDDYGVPVGQGPDTYPGVRRAADEYLRNKPESPIHAAHSMWYFVKQ